MYVICEDQVQQILTPASAIAVLSDALSRKWQETVRMPVRSRWELTSRQALFCMPCFDSELPYFGAKLLVASGSGNRRQQLNSNYFLFDRQSSELLACIQADQLTESRTAAVSAIVTDRLALPGVSTLGIFGTGRQARAHLQALRLVRDFRRFLICGSNRLNGERFAETVWNEQQISVEPVEAEECARQSDVICTCTTSTVPILFGKWLKPGSHLNLVGAYRPEAREVDETTIRLSKVVVDTLDGARSEAGDLLIPMREGVFSFEEVVADLHGLLALGKRVRASCQDITLFKSLGCGFEDLAVAAFVYERVMAEAPCRTGPAAR